MNVNDIEMNSPQKLEIIEIADLLLKVESYKKNNFRIVHIGCTKIKEQFEVIYAFEKSYAYEGVKIIIPSEKIEETIVPSISGIFYCAFMYENEINELFGVKIEGIKLDYRGNFFRTGLKAPMAQPFVKKDGVKVEVKVSEDQRTTKES